VFTYRECALLPNSRMGCRGGGNQKSAPPETISIEYVVLRGDMVKWKESVASRGGRGKRVKESSEKPEEVT